MLVEETGETAAIHRRIGLAAVCLHQQPSPHPLRVVLEPGEPGPLDTGAPAKLLLAYAPADIQDEVLGEPARAELRAELDQIVVDGIAWSDREAISDVVTLAVPVLRDDGIVAALVVLAPRERATLAWRTRTARVLDEAARAIARSLRQAPRVG